MCPYARIQSALMDRDTMVITYDAARGEARGPRSRQADPRSKGLGDCVDCTMCVQVCPTGIDIRHGLQNECIGCAACIDACDSVMDKVGYARGLIRYTTLSALEGRPTRVMRPRTWLYLGLLGGVFAAGAIGLSLRNPVGLDVMRDRNALYREVRDGWIENVYSVRILNKDERDHAYRLAVTGLEGVRLADDRSEWRVRAGHILSTPVRIRIPPGTVRGGHDLRLTVVATDDARITRSEKARFIAP
jgi:cytochrome c oxidase accessory protein FixG